MEFHCYPSRRRSAFTLVEMLVAITVLLVLVLIVNMLFSGTSTAITTNTHHMEADNEARLLFSSIANDFAGIIKRPDIDQLFAQEPVNDGMWFYAQAAAQYSPQLEAPNVTLPDPKSSLALIGYHISSTGPGGRYQLERLGQGLSWDNNGASYNQNSSPYQGLVLLTPPATPSTTDVWDPASTLPGTFPYAIGAAPYTTYTSANNSNYHVIGADVFRLELCFLLKDGTYSKYPAEWNEPGYQLTNSSPNSTTASPLAVPGARWVNMTTGQTYLCTSAPAASTGAPPPATFSGTGLQDVAAIIVTIAVLDNSSQQIISAAQLNNISETLLVDPQESALHNAPATPVQLPAELWQNIITAPNFAQTAGIPVTVAGQIRIYQRYFYLTP